MTGVQTCALPISPFPHSYIFFHLNIVHDRTHPPLPHLCEVQIATLPPSSMTNIPISIFFPLEKGMRKKKIENANLKVCEFVFRVWIWDLIQFVWFEGLRVCGFGSIFFYSSFFLFNYLVNSLKNKENIFRLFSKNINLRTRKTTLRTQKTIIKHVSVYGNTFQIGLKQTKNG